MYSNSYYLPQFNQGQQRQLPHLQLPHLHQQPHPQVQPPLQPQQPVQSIQQSIHPGLGTAHSLVLSNNSMMSQGGQVSSLSDLSTYGHLPSPNQSNASLASGPQDQLGQISGQLGIGPINQNLMNPGATSNPLMNGAANYDYPYKQPTGGAVPLNQYYTAPPGPAIDELSMAHIQNSKFGPNEIHILMQLLLTGEKFKWKQITREINQESRRRNGNDGGKNISPTFVIKQYQSLLGLPNTQLHFGLLGSSLPYVVHGWDAVNEVD